VSGSLPGVKLDRLDRRVRQSDVCYAFGLRVHTLQRSATPCAQPSTRVQCVAAQYSTSQSQWQPERSFIDSDTLYSSASGSLGLIPPLLHEIDAVASRLALVDSVVKLQRLDVPALVQRHAPRDGSRALPCKHASTRARVCVCGFVRSGQAE
jgi:hypothetical protein